MVQLDETLFLKMPILHALLKAIQIISLTIHDYDKMNEVKISDLNSGLKQYCFLLKYEYN